MEPRFYQLLVEAAKTDNSSPTYSANEVWYGHGSVEGLKAKMVRLLDEVAMEWQLQGHQRRHLYDLAYDTLYDLLPACKPASSVGEEVQVTPAAHAKGETGSPDSAGRRRRKHQKRLPPVRGFHEILCFAGETGPENRVKLAQRCWPGWHIFVSPESDEYTSRFAALKPCIDDVWLTSSREEAEKIAGTKCQGDRCRPIRHRILRVSEWVANAKVTGRRP